MDGSDHAAAGAGVGPPSFVGRDRELTLFVDAVLERRPLILVEGEAGIGKSRLVHECLDSPRLEDVVSATAGCPPLPEPFAWSPLIDAVRRFGPELDDVELSPLSGALRPLLPEWAEHLPPALEPLHDSTATRHRVCRAWSELLTALGVDLLVVEDVHWSDPATLEFLLMLCASATDGERHCSVVVTYRPDDVPAGSLLPRLTSHRPQGTGPVRIALEALDVEQTRRLAGSMFATEVSAEFSSYLHQRTEELPLAVEESVRLLAHRRDVARSCGEWTRRAVDGLDVPPTVRDLVLERVDRLDPDVRRVLEAAAVLAKPSAEAVLVEVSGPDDETSRRGVAGALDSGLLREAGPGRIAFRHVLASKAVEGTIATSERRELHHRAAIALQRRGHPPVVRLSRHFREAGEIQQWVPYAEAAAEVALQSGDDHAAVSTLLELLWTVDDPVERARLARKLGETIVRRPASLGDLETAVRDSLRKVVAEPDLPEAERGEIRLLLGWLLFQLGEFEAGTVEFESAVPELADRPASAARAMLLLATPESSPTWPADRHLAWLDQATELIPRVESISERRPLAIDRASTLLALGQEAGWQAADQIPESAANLVEQHHIVRGRLNVAQHAIEWGRDDYARRELAMVSELAPAIGFQRAISFADFDHTLLDWYTGSWDGLAERVSAVVEPDDVHPLVRLEAHGLLGSLDLATGDREAAERRLREVIDEILPTHAMELLVGLPVAALGRMWLTDGAADRVLQMTEPVMDATVGKGIWVRAKECAPVHVEALIAVGRVDDARLLIRRFAEGLHGRTAPAPKAALATCEALIESQDSPGRAAELFLRASAAWSGLPRPYDELRALEHQGCCLLADGDREHGLAVLGQAEARFRRLGARWDADRVAHLLRRHGVEVARTWRGGRQGYGDRLSPRELEVTRLVARGLTNRQAAETLFLSPKTVAHHLSGAMRKLGASSRTALARTAGDAGLLDPEDPDTD